MSRAGSQGEAAERREMARAAAEGVVVLPTTRRERARLCWWYLDCGQ